MKNFSYFFLKRVNDKQKRICYNGDKFRNGGGFNEYVIYERRDFKIS